MKRVLLVLAACAPPPVGTDVVVVDTDPADTEDPGPTGPHIACEAPATLPADPIVETGELSYVFNGADSSAELVDLEVHGDRLYAIGQPGVLVLDANAEGPLVERGRWDSSGVAIRFEADDEGWLYVVDDGGRASVVDARNLDAIVTAATLPVDSASSVLLHGDRLHVTSFLGTLTTFDITDPASPTLVGSVTGLSVPWEIAGQGDHAWVADTRLGLVPIDLTDPDAPTLGAPLDLAGGAQDIAVEAQGARAAVAVGTAGLVVADLSAPMAPTIAHRLDLGGTVVGAVLHDGYAWGVTQLDAVVFDLDAPGGPLPLGTETTTGFAMHVDVVDDTVWVADWYRVARYAFDREVRAPDLSPAWRVLGLPLGGGTVTSRWTNRGGAPLTIQGVRHRADLTVDLPSTVIAPGETIAVDVTWPGTPTPAKHTLCVVSDDPDAPVQLLTATTGLDGSGSLVGHQAPDFVLTDLDGTSHRLADQLGKPVVLAYFAVW